jgi:hypothetical protein
MHILFLVIPAKRADVKEKRQVSCRAATTDFREFFQYGRILSQGFRRRAFKKNLQLRGKSSSRQCFASGLR